MDESISLCLALTLSSLWPEVMYWERVSGGEVGSKLSPKFEVSHEPQTRLEVNMKSTLTWSAFIVFAW